MLKKRWPVILYLILVLIIFIVNFSSTGWVSGWDNLHPEFNFKLNITRSFFAVWQEYQGLGLLGGMGHASDLPRQLILFIMSSFVPINWLRQAYLFILLFVGSLGLYFLLEKKIFKDTDEDKRKLTSFFGGVFYLINLATMQTFYLPFSPFIVHFAFLPWLFLAALELFENYNFRNLLFFVVINILAIPQAYVPTVFLIYFVALLVSLFIYSFNKQNKIKRLINIAFLILIINAFWLLPFLYFSLTNSQVTIESKINQMATEKVLLQNKEFGDIEDVLLLKGFWFENIDFYNNNWQYSLLPWREHFHKPLIRGIGIIISLITFYGLIGIFRRRNKYRFIPIFCWLFSLVLLANNTPIISFINSIFYRLPLLNQVLRSPFTKFSTLLSFSLAILFAVGILNIFNLIEKFGKKTKLFKRSLIVILIVLIFLYSLPLFKGNLFYKPLKENIPPEYFSLFSFFNNNQQEGRIADFPQHTFWGWNFYRWNYRGSGFIWYGISQPIIDRAFDVWSRTNENYYWEVSYAVYAKNLKLLENVFDKYQVRWLLIDKNIINPSSPEAIYIEELEELLSSSSRTKLAKKFGKIDVYEFRFSSPIDNYIFLAKNLPKVGPSYKWSNLDEGYFENGNYFVSNRDADIYYPFRSLFTNRKQEELEFTVEDSDKEFIFKKSLPFYLNDYTLALPDNNNELLDINPQDLAEMNYLEPKVLLEENQTKIVVPKSPGYLSANIEPVKVLSALEAKNCDQFNQGQVKNDVITDNNKNWFRLKSIDATNCSTVLWLPNLPTQFAYLITVESRNIKGKSLLFWLENISSQKADMETYLPTGPGLTKSFFIQPPMTEDGLGYSLHFDNISIGRNEVINDLGRVTVNLIPYRFLTGIKLVKKEQLPSTIYQAITAVHPNPSLYEIYPQEISDKNNTLVLSQSFHSGWLAFILDKKLPHFLSPLFGQKIDNHVLVNNWENGWQLDGLTINKGQKIVIFFWPQFLEYAGFLLLLGFFGYFVVIYLKQKNIKYGRK
ncbi:MAG: hypothetical protein V1858_00280 [Candidatus Gottesmanbacteria bacterium]